MVCSRGESLTDNSPAMNEERIVKGTLGAVGGAAAGGIFGTVMGAMGGALQLGIPLGFLIGVVSAIAGNGFAGFLSALIGTTFISAVVFGLVTGVMYAIGCGAAGSTWGRVNNK